MARAAPPEFRIRATGHMESIQKEADPRVFRYLKFYGYRLKGTSEEDVAHQLKFESPAALYRRLNQDGFPVCPVCGHTPAKPSHCEERKGRRRQARRGTGQAIELPPAKGAEDLFRQAIKNMERDLLLLDSRREVYREERFETVSDYPSASTTYYRDTILLLYEDGEEQWRKLCEEHGQDPSIDHFFVPEAPATFPEGATQSPPEPLTELIALYILNGEPLDPLLEVLHPQPLEVNQERLRQAIGELRLKAGQLATLVRGGSIRRGPPTGELSSTELGIARSISKRLREGTSEAEIYKLLNEQGISPQEVTRLKNLKIDSPQ